MKQIRLALTLMAILAAYSSLSAAEVVSSKAGETVAGRDARTQWWRDAKFGVFICWGPCSIEATEIGWGRNGPRPGHRTGHASSGVPVERYDSLYKEFNPTKFNAREWGGHDQGVRRALHDLPDQAPRRVLPLRLEADRLHDHALPLRAGCDRRTRRRVPCGRHQDRVVLLPARLAAPRLPDREPRPLYRVPAHPQPRRGHVGAPFPSQTDSFVPGAARRGCQLHGRWGQDDREARYCGRRWFGHRRHARARWLRAGHPPIAVPPPDCVSAGKGCSASGNWSPSYSVEKAFDGDSSSRWGAPPKSRGGWVEVDLGAPTRFDRVAINEAPWNRVQKFELQYRQDGEWKTFLAGTTLGEYRRHFQPMTAQHVRLNILEAKEAPTIWEIQLLMTRQGN